MPSDRSEFDPVVRSLGLFIRQAAENGLMLDLEQEQVQCLRAVAGPVLTSCDGRTDVTNLAAGLERDNLGEAEAMNDQHERRRDLSGRQTSGNQRR